jgi:hypothetical protein
MDFAHRKNLQFIGRVINRGQTKQAVIAELNSISACSMLCFSFCNTFINVKNQQVRPLRESFDEARQAYLQQQHAPLPNFVFKADFQTIVPVRTPTDALERYIFEKISIRGRALAAAVTLLAAVHALDRAIKDREDLIAEIRPPALPPAQDLAKRYFGIRTANGILDNRFQANLSNIANQTDHCIFFSRLLADDLIEYGNRLRKRYAWKFRLPPKLQGPVWPKSATDLLPTSSQYVDWLKGFPKKRALFARLFGIAPTRPRSEAGTVAPT